MTDIYEQHAAAFSKVSAFVILDLEGERVATVAIKYPNDGAGRLYAYVHLLGVEMVRGHANGYGYDKRSAAVAAAIAKIKPYPTDDRNGRDDYGRRINARLAFLRSIVSEMDSGDWASVISKPRESDPALGGADCLRVIQAV